MRLIIKAKRMSIGTVSHGRRKVSEGKWVPVKKMKASTYTQFKLKNKKTVILKNPVKTGQFLTGIEVGREGDEIVPKGHTDRRHIIDLTLVSSETSMTMNRKYATLEAEKIPTKQSKGATQSKTMKDNLKKAKRMPIGTISHDRRKIAEGRWIPVRVGRQKKTLLSKEDIAASKKVIAKYKTLDLDKFVEERDKNLPKEFEAFVTKYTGNEYREKGTKSYLSSSGRSGYAITKTGDLISVFSAPGAHEGKRMIPDAIAHGAKMLDCLGPVLSNIYEKYGFKTNEILKWDDEYAPPGWNYKAHNRPNVYMMRLGGAMQKSKSDKDQMTPEFTELCKRYIKHLFGDEKQVRLVLHKTDKEKTNKH